MTPTDKPPSPCRCNCGYTCGGLGSCDLPMYECIKKHFVRDCDHKFDGPARGQSVVCSICGMSAMSHDARCGP